MQVLGMGPSLVVSCRLCRAMSCYFCSEAVNVFSMEVADVLLARAVEVSFASALSVVTPVDASSNSRPNSQDGSGIQDSLRGRPHSTPPDALSHMLKSQLLDYAPASMGGEERGPSCSLGSSQMLQHSHTINVAGLRAGSRDIGGVLDSVVDRALLDAHSESNMLCRFSSLSAASRGE